MFKFTTLAVVFFLVVPAVTHALPLNDDFTLLGTAGIYSDYSSRGMSQTLGDPAVQLGGTILHNTTGLYVGAWTSNVDFGYGLKTRQEMDYYAGWHLQINDDVSLDTGVVKYTYPREGQFNFVEYYSTLAAHGFKASLNYSPDQTIAGSTGQSTLYSWVGYETTLPYEVGLMLRYGNNDFKDDVFIDSDDDARRSYREWEVKVSKDFLTVTWGLSYVDSDLSGAECLNYLGFDDLCSAGVVASVRKEF